MSSAEKSNITCIVDYNGKHYIKNIMNGCVVEFDENYYSDFIHRKKYVLKELDDVGFFSVRHYNSISLMIMLSNSCNLNCNYCFEKNKNDSHIQDETIESISAFLRNSISSSTDFVEITFTGGEPLQAPDALVGITNKIKLICADMDVPVYFSVITNGTLFTEKILIFLNSNKFSIQITLDGSQEMHNRIRYFDDFSGSFGVIINNLNIIKLRYVHILVNVRVNISSPVFSKYDSLFRYLFETYPKFRVYIDFIDVPYSSPFYMNDGEKVDFYSKYLLLLKEYERLDIFNYFEGGNCMIRNKDGVTIGTNGEIYKCYSLVGESDFICGTVYDQINFSVDALSPMVYSCENEKCIFNHLCRGGCPYKNLVLNGRLDSICKFNFLKEINSLIFITDIVKREDHSLIKGLVSNVQYIQINI